MTKTTMAGMVLLVAVALLPGACSPVVPRPVPLAAVQEDFLRTAGGDYRIQAGDELDVRLFYTPDLSQTVTVRRDGKISLPLLGEMMAQGRTPADLSRAIEDGYALRLKRPQTVVNVRTSSTLRVFVGGEVRRPGVQALVGPMSVTQAVMAAEGLRDTARTDEVVVVRRGDDGAERQVFVVNLDAVVSGRDGAQDVMLQPFDTVVVPRSDVANVNLWVDQYIRGVLPFYTTAGFSYELRR